MAEAATERRPGRSLPTLERAQEWIGLRVDGPGGRSVGRLAGIYVDAEDGDPRWAVVRLGPLAGCTAIPFGHLAAGAGRLWAGYGRRELREAPRLKPAEALSAEHEQELCAHWGIREGSGRSAEIAHRDPDEVSAIPADLS